MKRCFPLKKEHISINRESDTFLSNYKYSTEIPVYPHPGSFGFKRKNHIHEGIDLYAENGDEVYSIEEGIVTNIIAFTGEIAASPWWNNTYSVMIKHKDFSINYGEIIPLDSLKVGDKVRTGELIGHVKTVLKINKGRPMSMLHLEMYEKETLEPIKEWGLNKDKPKELLDPTEYIKSIVINSKK